MSFSLFSRSLLEELQECSASMETPPPGLVHDSPANSNGLCAPIRNESDDFPLNDSDWSYDSTNLEWGDTDVYHDSQVFEFFNLQDAALNPHQLQDFQPELELDEPSASASRTLYSPIAHATQNLPSASASRTLYSPTAHHAAPHMPIGLDHADLPVFMQSQLQDWSSWTPDLPSAEPETHPNTDSTLNSRESTDVQLNRNGKRLLQIYPKGVPAETAKRQKLQTPEQPEDARNIRTHGACLRCHVQKLKCSEGRPCKTCQKLFGKAGNNKSLQWSVCVSSSLPELNIFALGVFSSEGENRRSPGEEIRSKPHFPTALTSFRLLVKFGLFSDDIVPLDELYIKVLRQSYGHHAADVHPFILEDRNPLYLLIRLNVILLGSPGIAIELVGRVRYLQKLRAICAIVTFELLRRAIDRTTLASSSQDRQSALIVQLALLLDQVVAMNGDFPAAALACARGDNFKEMRRHLVQFLTYYLHKLIPNCRGALSMYLQKVEHETHLGDAFWNSLSQLMPLLPLRKPPMVRAYADMGWKECGSEFGEALHEYFFKHCSITCE